MKRVPVCVSMDKARSAAFGAPLEHCAFPEKTDDALVADLVDDVIDSVESEKADEDQVDRHCEAHDPGRDHQKHSRDQGSDRQQRIASGEMHSSNIADSDAHLAWRLRAIFASGLKKIPQSREFNDEPFRQDSSHQRRLRRRMNFVQMTHGGRLGHELPQALVKGAVDQ